VELVLGYFIPGAAFPGRATPRLFVGSEVKFRF
jgi:hypothetical protein